MDVSILHIASGILLASMLTLVFLYPDRLIGTMARVDLAGPSGFPLAENHAIFGPVFTLTLPSWGRVIAINRPEYLAHVMKFDMAIYSRGDVAFSVFREFPGIQTPVSNEGKDWRVVRKAVQPIFSMQTFTTHTSKAMNEVVPLLRDLLQSASKQNVPVDWNDLSARIGLAMFCKSALSVDAAALKNDLSCLETPDSLAEAISILNDVTAGRLFNPFWRFTDKITGVGCQFTKARHFVWTFVNNIIQERKMLARGPDNQPQTDFLSSLLAAQNTSHPLLIRDTIVMLLFASRDNNQNSLVWAMQELFQQPQWLDKMRIEAEESSPRDATIAYQDLHRFPIHLAVFYETVRLWPGLPKNARVALKDDVLPGDPRAGIAAVPISKGDYLLWSDYNMMRNVSVWGSDAETFNPGRHLDDEGNFIKPQQPSFTGFGSGPRVCPGAAMSAYEFVAIWTGILPWFNFEPQENRPQRYMRDALSASMEDKLMISVTRRTR